MAGSQRIPPAGSGAGEETTGLTSLGGGEPCVVPRRCTLDGFAEEATRSEGVSLAGLDPITSLKVTTENTPYRMTILEPSSSKILIQGGSFFPLATEACLNGSGFGGSLLKVGFIAPGLRMEICSDRGRIITSRVRLIEFEPESSLPGPF